MTPPFGRSIQWMRGTATESDEAMSRALPCPSGPPAEMLLRLRPSLLALARARLRGFHDAQDAVQETCLRVLRSLETYRPEAPFEHWVFTIAANVIRDMVRRRKVRQAPPPPAEEVTLAPDEALEQNDDLRRIRRALDGLDPTDRAPLILYLLHGVPQREIAAYLDIPVEHLRVRLFRAVRKIRRAIKE